MSPGAAWRRVTLGRGRAGALAVVALLLAGCFGGGEPVASAVEGNATDDVANATLPDGRGQSAGLAETNRTEEGLGGIEHRHDNWQGQEQLTLFDKDVVMDATPLFPDGEGSQPRSVTYVKLPNGSLVFEGTDRLTLTFSAPAAPNGLGGHPSPAALSVQVLTAASSEFGDPLAVAFGEPVEVPVEPRETDMPHAVGSLWAFRLTTDRSDSYTTHLTVVAHKGREVVEWPGHPDFYADSDARVVLDAHVTTRRTGIHGTTLYDDQGNWIAPDKLVSWGTSRLEIHVNVTDFRAELPAEPNAFNLEFHNATVLGPEANTGSTSYDVDPPTDDRAYNFTVRIADYGMDSPYQTQSRWGFRMVATFGADQVRGTLCPGCFPYEVEYDVRIVAVHEAEDVARPVVGTGA